MGLLNMSDEELELMLKTSADALVFDSQSETERPENRPGLKTATDLGAMTREDYATKLTPSQRLKVDSVKTDDFFEKKWYQAPKRAWELHQKKKEKESEIMKARLGHGFDEDINSGPAKEQAERNDVFMMRLLGWMGTVSKCKSTKGIGADPDAMDVCDSALEHIKSILTVARQDFSLMTVRRERSLLKQKAFLLAKKQLEEHLKGLEEDLISIIKADVAGLEQIGVFDQVCSMKEAVKTIAGNLGEEANLAYDSKFMTKWVSIIEASYTNYKGDRTERDFEAKLICDLDKLVKRVQKENPGYTAIEFTEDFEKQLNNRAILFDFTGSEEDFKSLNYTVKVEKKGKDVKYTLTGVNTAPVKKRADKNPDVTKTTGKEEETASEAPVQDDSKEADSQGALLGKIEEEFGFKTGTFTQEAKQRITETSFTDFRARIKGLEEHEQDILTGRFICFKIGLQGQEGINDEVVQTYLEKLYAEDKTMVELREGKYIPKEINTTETEGKVVRKTKGDETTGEKPKQINMAEKLKAILFDRIRF